MRDREVELTKLVQAAAVAALAIVGAGCGGHNVWGVVRQSTPNAGFGNRATHIRTTIEFADAAGTTLDEIRFGAVVHPGIYTPSTGQRMRIAAENIAAQVGRYLKERTAVAK